MWTESRGLHFISDFPAPDGEPQDAVIEYAFERA